MSKRNWRWVSRDPSTSWVQIWGNGEPVPKLRKNTLVKRVMWTIGDDNCDDTVISHDNFLSLTGITVPLDRPIKVVFSAEVVE